MTYYKDLCVFRSPGGRGPKELLAVGVEQALSLSCNSTEREPVLRRLLVTPLGFCLRVIVNETRINF